MTISEIVDDLYGPFTSNSTKKKRDNKALLSFNRDLTIKKGSSRSQPPKFPIPRIRNGKKTKVLNIIRNNSRIDKKATNFTNFHTRKEEGQEEIRDIIKCVIENYRCRFCKYKGSHQDLETHYHDSHEKDLEKIPGIYLGRKIELLIINGDKYLVESILKL